MSVMFCGEWLLFLDMPQVDIGLPIRLASAILRATSAMNPKLILDGNST